MSNEPLPARTAARSRAEQRRSEALQLAAALRASAGASEIVSTAKIFENYLRNNDGSNLKPPHQ